MPVGGNYPVNVHLTIESDADIRWQTDCLQTAFRSSTVHTGLGKLSQ
jgi:hypothetical protein